MRIAFYNPTNITFSSGPEIWLSKVLPQLQKIGLEVTLFTTGFNKQKIGEKLYDELRNANVEIIEFKYFKLPFSSSPIPINLFMYFKRSYDFLYVFNGFAFQDIIGYIMAKFFKARLIYTVRAPILTDYFLHNIYQKLVARWVMIHSDKIHVQNQDIMNNIKTYNQNTFVLGSGIDKDILLQSIPKNRFSGGVFKVIFLGRLSEQKNIPMLLKTIRYISDNKSIHFYIAGDGEYKEDVKKVAKRYDNLTYLGFVEHSEIYKVLLDKHIFLNLSRYETFCLAILEAQACGLPVVTTDIKVQKDYNDQSVFKVLRPGYTIHNVSSEIKKLRNLYFNEKNEYLKLVKRSIENAKKFIWEEQTRKFIKLFLN